MVFPKCSVCHQQFTLKGSVPYLLPCLHAVCETCVTSAAGGVISCSTCQREVNLTDTRLKKDAVRQREIFHLTVKHRPTKLLCTHENDGNRAVCWCPECEEFLCGHCHDVHSKFKVTRKHVFQNLSDFEPVVSNTPAPCSIHSPDSLYFLDRRCKILICGRCRFEDHEDHEVEKLDWVAERILKQLDQHKTDLETLQVRQKSNIKNIRRETKITDRTHNTLREHIGHTFKSLRSQLVQRKKELLTDLEDQTKATKTSLCTQLNRCEEASKKCSEVLGYISKVPIYASQSDLPDLGDWVGEATRSFLDTAETQTLDIPASVFGTNGLSKLKSNISRFGVVVTKDKEEEYERDKETQTKDDVMAEMETQYRNSIDDIEKRASETTHFLLDKETQTEHDVMAEMETQYRNVRLSIDDIEKRASETTHFLLDKETQTEHDVMAEMETQYRNVRLSIDDIEKRASETTHFLLDKETQTEHDVMAEMETQYRNSIDDIEKRASETTHFLLDKETQTEHDVMAEMETQYRNSIDDIEKRASETTHFLLDKETQTEHDVMAEMETQYRNSIDDIEKRASETTHFLLDKETQTEHDVMAEMETQYRNVRLSIDDIEKRASETTHFLLDKETQTEHDVMAEMETQYRNSIDDIEKRASETTHFLLGLLNECDVHLLKPDAVDKSMVLKCIRLKYDTDKVNLDTQISTEGDLINRMSDTRYAGKGNLKNYKGTCSTTPLFRAGCPQYWEVKTRVGLERTPTETLLILEIGVCAEEEMDETPYVARRPYAYSMTVGYCTAHKGICRKTWKDGKEVVHLPDTIPNTAGSSHTLLYGVVYDDSRNKIVFIDVKENKVMSTLDHVDCSEPLWPMFGVYNLTVSMGLVVGSDINMTEEKKEMIIEALS
ncbi:myosin heavy chain, cardiac muscle isoform-like isoform X3 [Haliotis asinina]|uniref:myosin heavy chain, cardiac muscle isoform-like isoform X3 n=1 Tax=Haliotis asinina TaxID=109174 RepID=UPI00353271C0